MVLPRLSLKHRGGLKVSVWSQWCVLVLVCALSFAEPTRCCAIVLIVCDQHSCLLFCCFAGSLSEFFASSDRIIFVRERNRSFVVKITKRNDFKNKRNDLFILKKTREMTEPYKKNKRNDLVILKKRKEMTFWY